MPFSDSHTIGTNRDLCTFINMIKSEWKRFTTACYVSVTSDGSCRSNRSKGAVKQWRVNGLVVGATLLFACKVLNLL